MGSPITNILKSQTVSTSDLKGKTLAVDTYNQLYMFLSTIRQPDGTPLKDSHGHITSHLSGLFHRFTKLMLQGISFVFVFDGETPILKQKEQERRARLKKEAQNAYEEAEAKQDIENMKKYASRTSKITPQIISDSKKLITSLGFPIVDAPSEGEAQAAQLVKEGTCFAVMSQDADSLLFGSPRIIKNLTITQKRRKPGTVAYMDIQPSLIELEENLHTLSITQEQLILLGMLVGTDFNYGGIKGIGPKKALKLVKEHKNKEELFKTVEWDTHIPIPWKEIYALFTNMKIKKDIKTSQKKTDKEAVLNILVNKHDFRKERVLNTLEKIEKNKQRNQTTLGQF